MPFIHYDAEKYRELRVDDYRSYLISRSQPPIVYHSRDMHFKRLRVHARAAINRIDGFLHWMVESIAASKTRRLQRELALRGVRYGRASDNTAARAPDEATAKADRRAS